MSTYLENQKKADRAFSHYVRSRDCLRTTGSLEYGRCFTCGKSVPYSASQCGHFISRQSKVLRYNPKNAHLQCDGCNQYLSGNMPAYRVNMVALYGADILDEFHKIRWQSKKMYSAADLLDIERKFKSMKAELDSSNCGDSFPFVSITKHKPERFFFAPTRDGSIFDLID